MPEIALKLSKSFEFLYKCFKNILEFKIPNIRQIHLIADQFLGSTSQLSRLNHRLV